MGQIVIEILIEQYHPSDYVEYQNTELDVEATSIPQGMNEWHVAYPYDGIFSRL